MTPSDAQRAVETVWRLESPKLIAALTRMVRDLATAEDLAHDALVAGFWILQCRSKEEAIEWVKRCPNPMPEESEIEIRQIFEAEDFGEAFTPELREQEDRLRAEAEKLAQKR